MGPEWEQALACWSRYTQLSPPRLCWTVEEEKSNGLTGSFAMIRLVDHAVVISMRQLREQGLEPFLLQILAHEIGHHVYAPADLRDNARLLVRIRRGLPGQLRHAPMVANLYTDLLINDRLQRGAGLNMAAVYKVLQSQKKPSSELWNLYMRTYELLWSLPAGTLCTDRISPAVQGDAPLAARLIRSYSKDWLAGSGRFAALLLPYLEGMGESVPAWLDAILAGAGGEVPEGLSEVEEDERTGALHPAEDPALSGVPAPTRTPTQDSQADGRTERGPTEYQELLKSLGVNLPPEEMVARYYRERSGPHLIRFPVRRVRKAADPLPEGLEIWDVGSPLSAVDWVESLVRSPLVVPGLTTVERSYGNTEGFESSPQPVDLYLGVDCSGSMPNPAHYHSFPVLAGTVILRSALRAGARVMVCLSGEPGKYTATKGFIREEMVALRTLTGYIGTGYAFGIERLKEHILQVPPPPRPVHLLVLSDSDLFQMLDRTAGGWDIAQAAAQKAGGGATAALNLMPGSFEAQVNRLRSIGWEVEYVPSMPDLLAFARRFAQRKYQREAT